MVVALGEIAAQRLLGASVALPQLRGRFHPLPGRSRIAVMPTLAPGVLLQSPAAKRLVWEDMKLVMARLGEKP